MSELSDLILVPTQGELTKLEPLLSRSLARSSSLVQLCGFGVIASAARAGSLIARYRPSRVLLLGIAGTFDTQRVPVGSAMRFEQVACDGIGVGSGKQHLSAESLGWPQFSGGDAKPDFGDWIQLDSSCVPEIPAAGMLLTACAASANVADANERRRRFPEAVAEDMEGFSVALACGLAGVPLQIVRGISNEVGDRDHQRWKIDSALDAGVKLTTRLLQSDWLLSSTAIPRPIFKESNQQ